MKTTGIVRKIDELGRIVLPKELRKCLNINPGDDFQIIVENERIILEKYSQLKNIETEIIKIIDSFVSVTNYDISLVINDKIVNKENKQIEQLLLKLILERKIYINENISKINLTKELTKEGRIVIFPIVINSDLLGALVIISNEKITNLTNTAKILNNIIKNNFI